jgi:heme oxygenase (biliverdin-IX-beta and delta-forming)
MLAEQLKSATEVNHQQLEKQLVLQMKAIRSPGAYVELLQLFYTYFGGLEQEIARYIGPAELPDYNERRKTEALAHDITGLGGTTALKAAGHDLPQLHNRLQAFGALYVIEGSTLGGQIISQMMAKQLNLRGDTGLSFFKGYGERSGQMWAAFKDALNAQATTPQEAEQLIAAANETFLKFKEWIHKAGQPHNAAGPANESR